MQIIPYDVLKSYIMVFLDDIRVIKAAKAIHNRDKSQLKDIASESSIYTFQGMIPIINSLILQSDKFHNSQYKSFILLVMIIANNMLFSYAISKIISKTASLITGKLIGGFINKIIFTTIISATTLFFISSITYHKFCSCVDVQNDNKEQKNSSEQQHNSLYDAISDLSLIHSIFMLFIPRLIGTLVNYIIKKCRKMLSYTENEFTLNNNSQINIEPYSTLEENSTQEQSR